MNPGAPHHRLLRRTAVAIALVVVAGVGTVAAVNAWATSSTPTPPQPTGQAFPVTAAVRPPPDPHPSSPGFTVASDQNQSDPVLYRFGRRYFLFTSGMPGPPPVNVPVTSAGDFGRWGPVTDALPALPHWAVPGFTWAPDVHQFGSRFVLYFTAMVQGSAPATECIGDATGSSPEGPFHPQARPFICQHQLGGSIDPRVFTNTRGASWMLWKSDQNIGGSTTPTQLWSQPLSADGLRLTGRPHDLMGPDQPWQGSIVEAPDLIEVGHTYWVFYSGNWFNQAAYAIGAARCQGPTGPCADTTARPLLASNTQGLGPGEASVFADSSGVWLLYTPRHASVPFPEIPPRPVVITRIGLAKQGPYLAAGGPPPVLDPGRPAGSGSAP